LLFGCPLTAFDCFDEWYTVPIVKNTQNHWCTNRHRSTETVPTVHQRCTNRQKQSKDSQNSKNDHRCTNRHMSTTTVPTVYQQCTNRQKQSKDSQNSKNDHWCTNRNKSTKTVQQCTNRQKQSKHSQNSTKMTFGVPIVTGLPRLYQQCNNSLPIVNKNLAIANKSRVSCAHNTSRAFTGLNITP